MSVVEKDPARMSIGKKHSNHNFLRFVPHPFIIFSVSTCLSSCDWTIFCLAFFKTTPVGGSALPYGIPPRQENLSSRGRLRKPVGTKEQLTCSTPSPRSMAVSLNRGKPDPQTAAQRFALRGDNECPDRYVSHRTRQDSAIYLGQTPAANEGPVWPGPLSQGHGRCFLEERIRPIVRYELNLPSRSIIPGMPGKAFSSI